MKNVTLTILLSLLTLLLITSCSDNSASPNNEAEDMPEAMITLDNSGASAYIAISIDGDGATAAINTENPNITITKGGRYTFINSAGASSHPLDFRDRDGNKLFGQSRDEGSLENDPDIDVVRSGDSITFTLSDDLASQLSEYICFFHPGMNGSFSVIEAD